MPCFLYQSSTDETKCSQTSDEEIKCSQAQSQRQPEKLPEAKDDELLSEDESNSGSGPTLPGNIILFLEINYYKISGYLSCFFSEEGRACVQYIS